MTDPAGGAIELLTVGRISVDLYAEQLGVPLNAVRSFRKSVGGTATNVAVATARLGHHAAVFTRLGDDPIGIRQLLHAHLRAGVSGAGAAAIHPELGARSAALERIIADAKELLIAAGYAPNEAVKKLMTRLLYRDDLAPLAVATRSRTGASS